MRSNAIINADYLKYTLCVEHSNYLGHIFFNSNQCAYNSEQKSNTNIPVNISFNTTIIS